MLYIMSTRTIESVLKPLHENNHCLSRQTSYYLANPVLRLASSTHIEAAMRTSATTPAPRLTYRMSCHIVRDMYGDGAA